jgi:hypothetical protein
MGLPALFLSYQYRIYPSSRQLCALEHCMVELTFLWNYALAERKTARENDRRTVTYLDQQARLKDWRAYQKKRELREPRSSEDQAYEPCNRPDQRDSREVTGFCVGSAVACAEDISSNATRSRTSPSHAEAGTAFRSAAETPRRVNVVSVGGRG